MPERSTSRQVVATNVVDFEKRGSGLGRHYVYTVHVVWSDDSKLVLYRTYAEFFNLHVDVVKMFPIEAGLIDKKDKVLPELPRKMYIGRANVRKVAEKRREALDKYLEAFVKLEKKIVTCPSANKFFELRPTDLNPQREDQTSGRKSPFAFFKKGKCCTAEDGPGQISGPVQLEQYRAISSYKKNNKDQIDLVADREYEVVTKDTSGWWLVKREDIQGWAPASYLEPIHHNPEQDLLPKSAGDEQVISVKEYKSSDQFKDELSFPKHAVMKVIYKTLDGWWYVRYNETNGYAPAAYLKPLKDTQTFETETQAPAVEETALKDTVVKDTAVEKTAATEKRKFFGAPPRRESLLNVQTIHAPVKQRHEIEEPVIQEEEDEEKEEEEEEDEDQDTVSTLSEEVIEAEPYRAAADYEGITEEEVSFKIGDQVDVMTKEESGWWLVCVNENQKGWAPATYLEPVNVAEELESHKVLCKQPSDDSEFEKYVSTAEHIAMDEDEVSFPEGVIVTVLQKYMDGWWFASYNNQKGYVPSSFLEPAVDSKKAETKCVDVPQVKVRAPSIRNRIIPRRGTIDNFDTILSAMGKKQTGRTSKIAEEKEEEVSGNGMLSFSGRKLSSGNKPQPPLSRPPPHVPARPTAVQLQRCTVQVRVAYVQSESEMVRPIPVRPGGLQQKSVSPVFSGNFRPVSPGFGSSDGEHSDEMMSPAELSPSESSVRSRSYTAGDVPRKMKPAIPMSRPVPRMSAGSNVDSETCGILQDPSCSTSVSFKPRSRSPSPTVTSRTSTSQASSPSRSPPFLSPNRRSPISAPPLPPPSRNMDGTQQQKKDIYFV